MVLAFERAAARFLGPSGAASLEETGLRPDSSREATPTSDLVLVGGGHAHVQVLRRFMMKPIAGVRLTLVLDRPDAVYSGMVPGFVAGDYEGAELEIDCVPLARRAGARVVLAPATGLDPVRQRLEVAGRPPLPYDVVSFDVGSTVIGTELPGVGAHALTTRPIRRFVDEIDAWTDRGAARIAVIGSGAAGLELAFCLQARLGGPGAAPEIELIGAGPELLPGASAALRRRATACLAERGIGLRLDSAVREVSADAIVLADGRRLPFDRVVWATGAAPIPLLEALPLARTSTGFLRVRETLQSVDHDNVFAVGDCAVLDAHDWIPRAGVYAVRQGPILDANLRALLEQRSLRAYRPQRDFLSLLNLGGGRALGGKWGLAFEGTFVFALKDWIDRRFMERFQVLGSDGADTPGFPTPESMGMEEMACGGCAAKVGAGGLSRALERLAPAPADERVRIGLAEPDDAAAIATPSGDIVLATVDGFRAFTDDAWLVGRVATQNAVSDVDASGGTPRHALAFVTVPDEARAEETLFQTMAGVREVLDARGISLIGGHSTVGPELMVGLAVLGDLAPESTGEILPFTKAGLRPGDRLVLTKPLGTGVVLAADMQGRAAGRAVLEVHASMLRSNRGAAACARRFGASAVTDVSGFGLAVHLGEMLHASKVRAEIGIDAVPALGAARALLARGLHSSFHPQNAAAAARVWGPSVDPDGPGAALLLDPQTSGGLLIGVAPNQEAGLLEALEEGGDAEAAVVGRVLGPADPSLPDLQLAPEVVG